MPKGMVVKNKPPVRDKTGKRILVQMVGEFTDAEFKRLTEEGVVVPMEPVKGAKADAAKSSANASDDAGRAKTSGDKTASSDASDAAGDKAGAGSGKAL